MSVADGCEDEKFDGSNDYDVVTAKVQSNPNLLIEATCSEPLKIKNDLNL